MRPAPLSLTSLYVQSHSWMVDECRDTRIHGLEDVSNSVDGAGRVDVVEAYRLGWKAIPLARELLLSNCCGALSALVSLPQWSSKLMELCVDGPW